MADSTMYETLSSTAKSFIDSLSPQTPGSNDQDHAAILALLTDDFEITWGHDHYVSTQQPHLQGGKSAQGFVDHLSGMSSIFDTFSIDIKKMVVDERQREVDTRVVFNMVVKGETVVNDSILAMEMNEDGTKLVKATEFMDAEAVSRIQKLARGEQGEE